MNSVNITVHIVQNLQSQGGPWAPLALVKLRHWPEHQKSLALRFISVAKENKLEEILDDQIMNDESMEVLEEVAELAKQCLEMSGENRPSMREVSERLDRLTKSMQHPWAQQNPEEVESLLGESSMASSEVIVNTGNLSIEKEAARGLQWGR